MALKKSNTKSHALNKEVSEGWNMLGTTKKNVTILHTRQRVPCNLASPGFLSSFPARELSNLYDRHLNRPSMDDDDGEERKIKESSQQLAQVTWQNGENMLHGMKCVSWPRWDDKMVNIRFIQWEALSQHHIGFPSHRCSTIVKDWCIKSTPSRPKERHKRGNWPKTSWPLSLLNCKTKPPPSALNRWVGEITLLRAAPVEGPAPTVIESSSVQVEYSNRCARREANSGQLFDMTMILEQEADSSYRDEISPEQVAGKESKPREQLHVTC